MTDNTEPNGMDENILKKKKIIMDLKSKNKIQLNLKRKQEEPKTHGRPPATIHTFQLLTTKRTYAEHHTAMRNQHATKVIYWCWALYETPLPGSYKTDSYCSWLLAEQIRTIQRYTQNQEMKPQPIKWTVQTINVVRQDRYGRAEITFLPSIASEWPDIQLSLLEAVDNETYYEILGVK